MTKEQAKQVNGGAAAVLAVGLVVGILVSPIIGIVLILVAAGMFIYVFTQSRKVADEDREMPGDPDPKSDDGEDGDEEGSDS